MAHDVDGESPSNNHSLPYTEVLRVAHSQIYTATLLDYPTS